MKRSPSLLRSTPPSPRTPSVTRMPRTPAGHTMPVGWNCTISMSRSWAPASYASAVPSPVLSHEFEVTRYILPAPPVPRSSAAQRYRISEPSARRDTALPGAVENGAPAFQLEHALRRFAGVELSRAPVVEQLAALHRVREVDLPRVLIGDVVHGRRDSAFGHDGVCLAEQ